MIYLIMLIMGMFSPQCHPPMTEAACAESPVWHSVIDPWIKEN